MKPLTVWTRVKRPVIVVASAWAGLSLASWVAVPWVADWALAGPVSQALGRTVSAEAVRFNPLALSLEVRGFRVAGAQADAPDLLSLGRLVVDVSVSSLWRLAPVVEAVTLEAPKLQVARTAPGHFDIDDILQRLAKPKADEPEAAPKPVPRFAVHNIHISGGDFRFDDQPAGARHAVTDFIVALPFLSNLRDSDVATTVTPALSFAFNGTPFAAEAQATPLSPDHAGQLELSVGDIDLAAWRAYLPSAVPVLPASGRLSTRLSLRFAAPAGSPPQVSLAGQVLLKQLALVSRRDEALLSLGRFQLDMADVQPLRQQIQLAALTLDDLEVNARRRPDGVLNWLALLPPAAPAAPSKPPAAASAPGPAPAAASPWQVHLQRLTGRRLGVAWQDEAVAPSAQLRLQLNTLDGSALRWPLAEQGAPARLAAQLQASTPQQPDVGQLQLNAQAQAQGGQARVQLSGWDAVLAQPYLAQFLVPSVAGRLNVDATARWQGLPGAQPPSLRVDELAVADLQLREPADRTGPATAGWQRFSVQGVAVDLAKHAVAIEQVALQAPYLSARRAADGQLNLQGWVKSPAAPAAAPAASGPTGAPSASKAVAPAPAATPPWQLHLGRLKVDGAALRWRDAAAPGGAVALDVERLGLNVSALDWPAKPGLPVGVSGGLQVRAPGAEKALTGQIGWQGQLGLAPVAWRGRTQIDRFPAHALAAYGGSAVPVAVDRAQLGWQGQTQLSLAADGLRLAVQGDARLTDLLVRTRATELRSADDLLSWQALSLQGIDVKLAPGQVPQLALAEGSLTDFYARLLVTEQGRLNLNDLAPPAAASSAASSPAPAPAPVAAAAPASAASSPAMLLTVGGLKLRNGRVDFTDRFIRPNYSAALSELNGSFGRFGTGSREMAPLELTGKIAGTGVLDVRGAVNPLVQPPALDARARASDLELAPMTPYAGKYAGYGIERGKLSVDLAYRIDPNGTLKADNRLVLNQLTFGEATDSPDATKLPVRLAVALLSDRHGVIDLNLPIGGSINDPEFSVGGLVMKVLGNLLVKAATAPFSMFSGGDEADLSTVPFAPGLAQFGPEAATALDRVAQSLTDRPALKMTVTGAADPQSEREAIQTAWLQGQLVAERRKELLAAGAPLDVVVPALSADDRNRLLRRLQAQQRGGRFVGPFSSQSPEQIEAELKASYVVGTDQAHDLALRRGLAVRDALIAKGLPRERLFLAAPRLRLGEEDAADWSPQVKLSLAAD